MPPCGVRRAACPPVVLAVACLLLSPAAARVAAGGVMGEARPRARTLAGLFARENGLAEGAPREGAPPEELCGVSGGEGMLPVCVRVQRVADPAGEAGFEAWAVSVAISVPLEAFSLRLGLLDTRAPPLTQSPAPLLLFAGGFSRGTAAAGVTSRAGGALLEARSWSRLEQSAGEREALAGNDTSSADGPGVAPVSVEGDDLLEVYSYASAASSGGEPVQAPGGELFLLRVPTAVSANRELCVFSATFVGDLNAASRLRWAAGGARCTRVPPPPPPPKAGDSIDVLIELALVEEAAGVGEPDAAEQGGGLQASQRILAVNLVAAAAPLKLLAFSLLGADEDAVPIAGAGGGQLASQGFAVAASRQLGAFQAICEPALSQACAPLVPPAPGGEPVRLAALLLDTSSKNLSLPLRADAARAISADEVPLSVRGSFSTSAQGGATPP